MAGDEIKESILSEHMCDICNGELKNIAVIKKCFHFFCLPCLQQYSDVTNKCPTCSKEYTYFLSNITGDLKGKVNRVKTFDECSICLDGFQNKAKLDACNHEYCFECIKSWSSKQNECPVCRQPFSTIFYNFRSQHDYDVHLVALQDEESSDKSTEQNEQFEDQPDEYDYPPHRYSQISEPIRPTLSTARDIAPSRVANFNHSNFGGVNFNTMGFNSVNIPGINAPLFDMLPPAYDQMTHFIDGQFHTAVESRNSANASSTNNNTVHSANQGIRIGSRFDSSDAHKPFQSTRSTISLAFRYDDVSPAPVNPSANNNAVRSANQLSGSRLDSNYAHNPFRSTRRTSSGYRHEYNDQSFSPAPLNSPAKTIDGSRSTIQDGLMMNPSMHTLNPQDGIRKPLLTNNSKFPDFSDETFKSMPTRITFQDHFEANLSNNARPFPPPQGLVARPPRRSHLDPSFHPYNFPHGFQNTGNYNEIDDFTHDAKGVLWRCGD